MSKPPLSVTIPDEPSKSPRLLGIKDAAAELGISAWTLRGLIGEGRIRTVQPPGVRRIWIDRRDLERAIQSWKA